MRSHPPSALGPTWLGLVDDAAVFPPGDVPLPEALEAYAARTREWYAGFVGTLVLPDTDLPRVRALPHPLSVVVTGGAGQLAGPLRLAATAGLDVRGLEIALRDPDDPPGNARRVVAAVEHARLEGLLEETTPVYVELPQQPATPLWLAAADEVAAAELRLKLRTGGLHAEAFPSAETLAGWIDAALDRETPFKATAGLHRAVRHRDPDTGFEHHGFLNLLAATAAAFEGAARDEVVAVLEQRDPAALVAGACVTDLQPARRWFTCFGSCSVIEPLESLAATGLLGEA